MSNKNFQFEENEILSADEEKVRRLLGDLQRVDAPSDFDFRLKARIRNADAKDFQPAAGSLFPFLRYAAPLALALIVLGVFVAGGLYSFDSDSVPAVASNREQRSTPEKIHLLPPVKAETTEPPTVAAASPASNNEFVPAQAAVTENKNTAQKSFRKTETVLAVRGKKAAPIGVSNPAVEGGSKDSAASNPGVIVPKGFESANANQTPKEMPPSASFSVGEALEIFGIKASFAAGKWKVASVAPNSLAERSGLKANDVIEAIDENKLTGEKLPASPTGAFSGRKLTVLRGGQRIEINLQNK